MTAKIICCIGTRPEAIKMAPVILALNQQKWANVRVLATAQDRQRLDQVLAFFTIILEAEKPDVVLAQGDTTTVMAVALACFYHLIPFGHIVAGLRTVDIWNPFPEEANRAIAGRLARWHFAPTEISRQNLLKDGIPSANIIVTGITVIDSLLMASEKEIELNIPLAKDKRLILVTAHRRENFGEPFKNICRAICTLAELNDGIQILFPVHPNPNIKNVAHAMLGGRHNILLCEPLDYAPFIAAMKSAYIII